MSAFASVPCFHQGVVTAVVESRPEVPDEANEPGHWPFSPKSKRSCATKLRVTESRAADDTVLSFLAACGRPGLVVANATRVGGYLSMSGAAAFNTAA